jgi:diguanylate cyclase (GGDEF)-like protein
VETLQVARAVDAALAASSRVVFLVIDPHRGDTLQESRQVMDSLAGSTNEFRLALAELNHVPELAAQLTSNLSRVAEMLNERLVLEDRRDRLREELLLNLQSFQMHLTHRTRLLQGDADIIAHLMAGDAPDVKHLAGIVQDMTGSLSTMRFYTEIEAIHGRLQSAGQDQSVTDLDLSQSVLRSRFQEAARTYRELPQLVAVLVADLFAELDRLINSADGPVSLRRSELELFKEGLRLLEENRLIGMRIDAETRALVRRQMGGIAEAGRKASQTRDRHVLGMSAATLVGLAGLSALLYFQVHRRLIQRLTWLSNAMQQVAAGETDAKLPPAGDDELGRLGHALRQFRATEVNHRRQEDELRASNRQTAEALSALEEANRKLADLSAKDGLTGLANRRRFDEALKVETARATHARRPFALLMIDVDYFKDFNDRFGHQAGDDCLKRIATAINSQTRRASDVAARYGGEEFCIISAYTDRAAALALAESVRNAVKALRIRHASTAAGVVTVSIGFAVANTAADAVDALSAEALLRAADRALYDAKELGRDRVEEGLLRESLESLGSE